MSAKLQTLLILAIAVIAGCAARPIAAPSPDDPLVGYWHARDYQPLFGTTPETLLERRSDGGFVFTIQGMTAGGGQGVQAEEGRWTRAGNRYTTITTRMTDGSFDATGLNIRDDYKVLMLDNNTVELLHIKTGAKFKATRVDAAFRLP